MKNPHRIDKWWLLTAGVLILLQFWWLPGDKTTAGDSYSNQLPGKRGLYETLKTLPELFPNVDRQAEKLVADDTDVLLVLGPSRYPTESEADRLRDWVRQGGVLLFAQQTFDEPRLIPELYIETEADYWDLRRLVQLGLGGSSVRSGGGRNSDDSAIPSGELTPFEESASEAGPEESAAVPEDAASTRELLEPGRSEAVNGEPEAQQKADSDSEEGKKESDDAGDGIPASPPGITPVAGGSGDEPYTVSVSSSLMDGNIVWEAWNRLNLTQIAEAEVLVKGDGSVYAASWRLGKGTVIACAGDAAFANEALVVPERGELGVRLCLYATEQVTSRKAPADRQVTLSEYFNATQQYRSTGLFFSPELRAGTLQLILAAVLLVWSGFHRFGPAEQAASVQRRSLRESAEAMGNLQFRCQDGGFVVRSYLDYLLADVKRLYGPAATLNDHPKLASRTGIDEAEIREKLAEADQLAQQPVVDAATAAAALKWLIALRNQLHDVRTVDAVRSRAT